jgi:hypothetical protein
VRRRAIDVIGGDGPRIFCPKALTEALQALRDKVIEIEKRRTGVE